MVASTSLRSPSEDPFSVAKLNANGLGLAWTQATGIIPTFGFNPVLAADSSGRIYVAAFERGGTQVVRLNAAGNATEYNRMFSGMPTSIAVDASGSAFLTGYSDPGIFLARFTPDGGLAFLSTAAHPTVAPSVAVGANGNALVYSGGVLKRFDPTGALLSSKSVAFWKNSYPGIALDVAGNAYITGSSTGVAYPVKNTLATCESELLSVIAPDDTVLQTTYIARAASGTRLPLIVARDSTVLLAPTAAANFTPTRTGPFAASDGAAFLNQLSAHADARTFPLACAVNGLSFQTGAIAPGEIVTLSGNGLGPEIGVAGSATLQAPFPIQLGNVQATVNGAFSPLLWAQDRQINLIVPWGLAPGPSAEVCVLHNGAKTNCLTLPTSDTAPGVATVDGVYAAAMNQDGTLNSPTNPAPANSIVAIWVTGLGPVSPSQFDGAIVTTPLPSNLLFAFVEFTTPNIFPGGGGTSSLPEMTYAGPAPSMVSGVSQINFRATGRGGSYVVKIGTKRSQEFQIY